MESLEVELRKIAKGAGIFSIGLVISKILTYIDRLIVARVGVEQYGLFSLALAVFGILITCSMLGMSDGVIRFVSFYKGKADERRIKGTIITALKITVPLSAMFGLFLFLFSDVVAITFFHDLRVSILLKILAFALPLDTLRSIFLNSLRAFQRIDYEVYAKSLAEGVSKVILTLIAIYLGFGIIGVTFAYLFSIFISFILSFYFLEKKVFPILKTKIISLSPYKDILFYSFPLLLTSFLYLIIQWTDTLMLGYFRTPLEVGVYNAALPTAFLLFLFPSAIRTLFFPVLNELYAQGKQIFFESVYQTVVKWIILVDSILFVFLVIFSKQIIGFLFGKAYILDKIMLVGKEFSISGLCLIILASGMIFPEFVVPTRDILLVLKKTKFIFINTITGTIVNIFLNYMLVPKYGAIGSAIATASASLLMNILLFIQAYKITKINPFKRSSLKVLVISLFMLIVLYVFKVYTITNIFYLITTSLIIFFFYLVLLLFTKSFDKEDLMVFKSIKDKSKKFI